MKHKKTIVIASSVSVLFIVLGIFLFIMSLPFIVFFMMWVTSIPDQIRSQKMDEKRLEISSEMVALEVNDVPIHVDTMTVYVYGVQEVDHPTSENIEYEYIGGNRYRRGYSEMVLQLQNLERDENSFYEDTDVVNFLTNVITMLNESDLDYKYCNDFSEYYYGFDDDTTLESLDSAGELHTYNYAFEGGISISFHNNAAAYLDLEESESLTLRLLFGLDEDSKEYEIGEQIKAYLIEYGRTLDDYRVIDVENTVDLINHESVIPEGTFD